MKYVIVHDGFHFECFGIFENVSDALKCMKRKIAENEYETNDDLILSWENNNNAFVIYEKGIQGIEDKEIERYEITELKEEK